MKKTNTTSISGRLVEALDKVDRPGTFCTSGSVPAVLPGLEVKGLGPIGLPLTPQQLKSLKRRFVQAPYGKGVETLVDTKVRRVLRLTPDRFSLTNPAWATFLDETVARVQADLGLEGQKLEAHLYDLLLYEAGSFFLPHQDGEKLDRMVATLVVVLPSKYEGGELVVRHEGQEKTIDSAGPDSLFRIHWAAFYADCEHEVKPLKSGYRLCLVYNLTLAPSAKSKKGLSAPQSAEHVAEIAEILREWHDDADAPPKLAVTLDHEYTKDGLSWDALKGVDRAKADVLEEAARQAGCQAYLALLTFWESGSAEEEYGGYGYRRHGRYGRSWPDEGRDGGGGSHKMMEVFDQSLSAEQWRCPDGSSPPLGKIPVEESEVAPPESLKAIEPEEDFEGYTGNAGMTLERWYRHAAILVWPEERSTDVVLQAGSRSALSALERMVSSWETAKGPDADEKKARCLEFAGKILARWPERKFQSSYESWRGEGGEKADASDPMTSLQRLDDPHLLRTYLRETLLKDVSLEPGRAAAKAVVRHGWATFRPELAALFQATGAETIERNVRFLEQLCQAAARGGADKGSKRQDPEASETCRILAEATVAAVERIDALDGPDSWRAKAVDRAKLLASLTKALLSAGLDDLLSRVIEGARKRPEKYPLRPVRLQTLAELASWLKKNPSPVPSALAGWVAACRQELEALTAAEPQPPADLQRDAGITCACADCGDLKTFLRSPQQEVGKFQMAQHRRSHLESQIRNHQLDVTFTTDKRPGTHVLVCTKSTASFQRRLKQYHEDLGHLAAVRSLEDSLCR